MRNLALLPGWGLHTVLASLIEPGQEEVPWQNIAAVLTTARFCAQRSELGIAEHWYERTALEDITGIPFSKINDDRLYRGLDVLAAHSRADWRKARQTARSAARRVPQP